PCLWPPQRPGHLSAAAETSLEPFLASAGSRFTDRRVMRGPGPHNDFTTTAAHWAEPATTERLHSRARPSPAAGRANPAAQHRRRKGAMAAGLIRCEHCGRVNRVPAAAAASPPPPPLPT